MLYYFLSSKFCENLIFKCCDEERVIITIH